MMDKYEEEDRGVRIVELENSFQMCTKPEMYEYLIRVARQPRKYVLTDVLLETLSIIAYKQPVTKLEDREDPGSQIGSCGEQAGGVQSGLRGGKTGRAGTSPFYSGPRRNSCAGSAFIPSRIFRA